MKILGISAYYHDSGIAFIEEGEIIFAEWEERFTREKHDSRFPITATRSCLDYVKILEGTPLSINDLAAVVFYDKPFLKFERLLETYRAFAPKGLTQFLSAIPVTRMFYENRDGL